MDSLGNIFVTDEGNRILLLDTHLALHHDIS